MPYEIYLEGLKGEKELQSKWLKSQYGSRWEKEYDGYKNVVPPVSYSKMKGGIWNWNKIDN